MLNRFRFVGLLAAVCMAPAGDADGGGGGGGQVPPPPANPPTPPAAPAPSAELTAKLAALEATVAKQSATIASLSDENARRRNETKAEREQREAAEVASGNFRGKAERLEAEVTTLQQQLTGLTAKAQQWDAYETTRSATIEAEGKNLPAQWQPLWALTKDLPAKEALLAGFKASQPLPSDPPKQPAPPAPPGGAPPPSPPPTGQHDPRTMSIADLKHLEQTNPDEYNKLMGAPPKDAPKKKLFGFIG